MFAKLHSVGLLGMDAFIVEVETYLSSGLPVFDLVGLPDLAVKESRNRVRAAIKNCGYEFPVSRIVSNLAPADRKKGGALYDLPLFLSLLLASGQLQADVSDSVFIGELSLTGAIRPATGVLAMAIKAAEEGFSNLFVPASNAAEGSVVKGIHVYPVHTVDELIAHLTGKTPIPYAQPDHYRDALASSPVHYEDFSDVRGQPAAKRALEIAAAGGHNVMLIGPPGSGKSMLAKRMPSILPDMTFDESIATTKLHSIAGSLPANVPLITVRPFRAPHHTISPAGLTGGGMIPQPGEISLAHNGVLFLDELPEFSRAAMEVLRQPLEDRRVTISRVWGTISYPCEVMLIAAMNPCPCGYYGHPTRACTCTKGASARYLSRVSGPLLDRLDLHVEVPPVDFASLDSQTPAEPSREIRKRVNRARAVQQTRYQNTGISSNAMIPPAMLHQVCNMTQPAHHLLKNAFERLGLSSRAYDRILKVSRTIADLEGQEQINGDHILEAIQYRSLDRKYWQN